MSKNDISAQTKFNLIMDIVSGKKTAAQVARENNLPSSTVSGWKKQFMAQGPDIFSQPKKRRKPKSYHDDFSTLWLQTEDEKKHELVELAYPSLVYSEHLHHMNTLTQGLHYVAGHLADLILELERSIPEGISIDSLAKNMGRVIDLIEKVWSLMNDSDAANLWKTETNVQANPIKLCDLVEELLGDVRVHCSIEDPIEWDTPATSQLVLNWGNKCVMLRNAIRFALFYTTSLFEREDKVRIKVALVDNTIRDSICISLELFGRPDAKKMDFLLPENRAKFIWALVFFDEHHIHLEQARLATNHYLTTIVIPQNLMDTEIRD